MAFTDLGHLVGAGNSNNNQSALNGVTQPVTAAVGELVVICVAVDNPQNAGDAGVTAVTVTGTSNVFTKAVQVCNAVAAQGGASISIWYSVLTQAIPPSSAVVATFGTASTSDASAMTGRRFSVGAGKIVALEGTPTTLLHNTALDPGALDLTTANIETLRIRACGIELGTATNWTPTASWTAFTGAQSATSGTTAEMAARAEFRIVTGTSASSNPTQSSAINANAYVAFKELNAYTIDATTPGSYSLTGTAANVRVVHKLTAAVGGYTLTGTAAGLVKTGPPEIYPAFAAQALNDQVTFNFGTTAYAGTKPTGFLNWDQLPAPSTILVAGAGSYTLTGTAATLEHGWKIAATTAGSYALTGTPQTLQRGVRASVVSGSYALTGTAAILRRGRIFVAGSGSYALTGTPATLRRTLPLVTSPGSYTLTGTATGVLHGWEIPATVAGSYTLTGTATSILHKRKLVPDTGSYTLTGTPATFRFARKVIAASGSYTLTGTATGVLLKRKLFVTEIGSYTLTGTPAGIGASKKLVVTGGSYTLTGAVDTFLPIGRKMVATLAGSYALTGTAVTIPILRHKRLIVDAGSYTLTGSNVSLIRPTTKFLVAAPGSYVLTGTPATLFAPQQILPARYDDPDVFFNAAVLRATVITVVPGSYTLAGQAQTLRRNLPLVTSSGNYTLTGSAQTLQRKLTMTATLGSYALTGTATIIRRGVRASVVSGSYTLTGTPATLTIFHNKTLTAVSGSYTLTGTPAGVFSNTKLFVTEIASYTLTGAAAALRRTRAIVAAPGNYALTGTPATLRINIPIVAAPGSYNLTGTATGIRRGLPLRATTPGSYTLTGIAPTALRRAYVLKVGASVGDPDFSNVVLLTGFEGVDASTTITDESSTLKGNATVTGNAQVDTEQFKFGAASLLLDGTGDKISFPDSADWQLDGPFTIEAWLQINSFATATTSTIIGHGASSISYGWWLTYSNAGALRFRFDDNGDGTALHDIAQVAAPMTTNTWYHVAVDRDAAGKLRLYVDGVMRASKVAATGTSFNSPSTLDIGYLGSSTSFTTNGRIDEVRITKGVARYASDAGFTVPNAAFPRSSILDTAGAYLLTGMDVDTLLLAHGELFADSGNYTLTGTPATLRYRRTMAATTAGSYSLTGTPALLKRGLFLPVVPGSYTLTGTLTGSLLHRKLIITSVGSYTLTGSVATLAKGGAQQVRPPFFVDPDVFYPASVAIFQGLYPELFVNQNQFFQARLQYTQVLSPARFDDPDVFFPAAATIYYEDTETVCVHYEDRRMSALYEYRIMMALAEDRSMEVRGEECAMDVSPRRRTC